MPDAVVLNVHTHKMVTGSECSKERGPCTPMKQAMKRGWFLAHGRKAPFIGCGDREMDYVSVFNFCPFCAAKLADIHDGYMVFREDRTPAVVNPETGESTPLKDQP